MISLDITSVTNEIFALTALRKIADPDESTPEPLCRDQLPALRVLIRSAFARVAVSLAPYLDSSACDPADTPAAKPYDPREQLQLEFDFGDREKTLTSGSLLTLKRYLEHLLALHVLSDVYAPLESPSAASARAAESATLLTRIHTLLILPSPIPLLIHPSRY